MTLAACNKSGVQCNLRQNCACFMYHITVPWRSLMACVAHFSNSQDNGGFSGNAQPYNIGTGFFFQVSLHDEIKWKNKLKQTTLSQTDRYIKCLVSKCTTHKDTHTHIHTPYNIGYAKTTRRRRNNMCLYRKDLLHILNQDKKIMRD